MSLPAVEVERLLREAPFVNALARALAGSEADEVVQETWRRALQGPARAVQRPREWLACVARRVAQNLRRGQRRRAAHEQRAARADGLPSASELLERQERRAELTAAVQALPEPLRTVVLLRWFEDLPPRRIAAHLGLPVTTVKGRLRTALQRLRDALDRRHGDRRAWLAAVLPFAGGAGVAAVASVLIMSAKAKLAVVAAVALLALVALRALDAPGAVRPTGGAPPAPPTLAQAELDRPRDEPGGTRADPGRAAVPPPQAGPTTGSLLVTASHIDGAPAGDLLVFAGLPDTDYGYERRRLVTDAAGRARIAELAPGRWLVMNARNPTGTGHVYAEVRAGEEAEAALRLPTGATLAGVVVDWLDRPVASAQVFVHVMDYPEVLATTDAQGRFSLRSCLQECAVGVRAAGYAPSRLEAVFLQEGDRADLRFVLPGAGGELVGLVVDAAGAPVADAVVEVGEGSARSMPRALGGVRQWPASTRSDAEGRFVVHGLPPGDHAVRARARGLAPIASTCRIEAHVATTIRLLLPPGVVCAGVVRGAGGAPLAGVEVTVGAYRDMIRTKATSAADGSFRLAGLPVGEVEVRASHETGEALRTIRGAAGETVVCDLQIDAGRVLRGVVLDAAGVPVAGASVTAQRGRWSESRTAGRDGRFAIPNCPEAGGVLVRAFARGHRSSARDAVDPLAGELVLQLAAAPAPSVRITGRVLAPDGTPVAAQVAATSADGETSGLSPTSDDGHFALGPLPPGTWRVRIWNDEHPYMWTEPRALAADAVCEFGDVRLPEAGRVEVTTRNPRGLRFTLAICDAGLAYGDWSGFERDGSVHRSRPLPAGRHLVSVVGEGVASQLVPVVVTAGTQTPLALDIGAGQPCDFAIEAAAGVTLAAVEVEILRDGALVSGFRTPRRWTGELPLSWRRWLEPGDYTMVVRGDGRAGRTAFRVPEAAATPVAVTVTLR